MVAVAAPNGIKGNVHLSISDASGDSAILEYIKGKLVIHHGRQNRAADRFARASFYINAASQSANPREAVAAVFSVMRNVSVPRGISTPSQPNISSTIWRTVADQKNKVYYFEDTASPSLVWVRLNQLDFRPGSGVRKVTLNGNPDLGGDQTTNFKKAGAFKFMAPH